MSDGYFYSCDRAIKQLGQVVRLLADHGILQVAPDEGMIRQCVRRCAPCEKDKGPKRCRGWKTVVDRGVLALGPVTHVGRSPLRLEVSAICGFQRDKPARENEWRDRPMASSTVALEIFDIKSDELLERHHLDLANPGQAGTAWHLQYGGNPAAGIPGLPTAWLGEPRWPVAPADLTLLLELVAYNFFPDEWAQLNEEGEWLRLIWAAENLVVSHYARFIDAHFGRQADLREGTWLAVQDNNKFDPRPKQSAGG
jgi:hypothetical protein